MELWGRTFVSIGATVDGQVKRLVPGTRIRLTFGTGSLRANAAGCNQLSAQVRVDGAHLVVSDAGSTLMACDSARLEQESWLADLLRDRPAYRLDGDELVLRTRNAELRLTDSARDLPSADRPL